VRKTTLKDDYYVYYGIYNITIGFHRFTKRTVKDNLKGPRIEQSLKKVGDEPIEEIQLFRIFFKENNEKWGGLKRSW
jgi:hypothetical protein